MEIIAPLLLIVAGILAISNLIVAKKPDAKALLDKLLPYQAGIGVAVLVVGVVYLLVRLGTPSVFDFIKIAPLLGLAMLSVMVCSVLLGFMFGMPQIAKWMPGENAAEQKGIELSKKLAPFQVIIGIVGIASAFIVLLYRFEILTIHF